MDHELINVAWVTASVVAGTGTTLMALVLICKATQRCRHRCLSRHRGAGAANNRSAAAAAKSEGSVGVGGGCCCCCFELPAVASAVVNAQPPRSEQGKPPPPQQQQQQQQQPDSGGGGGDSFHDFLQLSFNTAAANGPERSPVRGRHHQQQQHQQHQPQLRQMTFEISNNSDDTEEAINCADDCSVSGEDCDKFSDASHRPSRQQQLHRLQRQQPHQQKSPQKATGGTGSFYDIGGYDAEWPPGSGGGGGGGFSQYGGARHHQMYQQQHQQQQQQQQGRRAHIFFGRGGSRYSGNM